MLNRILHRFDNHILTATELRLWSGRAQYHAASRVQWLSRVFVGTMTVLSLLLFVYECFAVWFNIDLLHITTLSITRRFLLQTLILGGFAAFLAAYAIPLQRTRVLARQIIARDKSKRDRWELITLTGVDARSYVRAKWWTIMRMIAPQLIPAAIIRAGVFTFAVGELTRAIANSTAARFPNSGFIDSPSPFDILVIGVLSVLLTFSLLPSLAAGSVDDMLDSPRYGNTWWGWFGRGAVSLIEFITAMLLITVVLAVVFVTQQDGMTLLLIGMFLWTAIDNGWTITGQLAASVYFFSPYQPPIILLDAGQVVLIVLLTLPFVVWRAWIRLKMAEWTAQRYQLVKTEKVSNGDKI